MPRETEKKKKVQGTNSFFFVLNCMSPKARETEISPHIRPSLIYEFIKLVKENINK